MSPALTKLGLALLLLGSGHAGLRPVATPHSSASNQQQTEQNTQTLKAYEQHFDQMTKYDVKAEATVDFSLGSTKISPLDQEELKAIAQTTRGMDGYVIEVVGYGDSTDLAATNTQNIRLTEDRTQQVVDFLVRQGVPLRYIAVAGTGKYSHTTSNDTKEGRGNNRSVEVKVLSKETPSEAPKTPPNPGTTGTTATSHPNPPTTSGRTPGGGGHSTTRPGTASASASTGTAAVERPPSTAGVETPPKHSGHTVSHGGSSVVTVVKPPAQPSPPPPPPPSTASAETAWFNSLQNGPLQYSVPPTMLWKVPSTVTIQVSGEKVQSPEPIDNQSGQASIKVARRMKVLVSAPDNPDEFTIEPESDTQLEQYVPENGPTIWHFSVTPRYTATAQKLAVQAWVIYDANTQRELPVYKRAVNVNVPGFAECVKRMLEGDPDYWAKYALPGGAGFIFVTGIVVGLWKWLTKKKGEPPPDPEPAGGA